MAEIKEIRDAMRKRKKIRNIRRISIFIILAALVVMVVINRDKFNVESIGNWLSASFNSEKGDEGFPVSMPSGEVYDFSAVSGNLVLTNQTNVFFYSSRGRRLRGVQHSKKNVQTKCAGEYVLTYSAGSDGVSLENYSKTITSFKSEKNVITGAVAKNGNFILATESDVYTSQITVYDKNSNAIFRWTPSLGVVTAVSISEDGHFVAASTAYTQGGRIMSGVYLFSISKKDALLSQNIEDQIVLSLMCQKDDVTAICDSSVVFLLNKGKEIKKYSFEEKKLISYVPCDKGLAMAFRDVNDPGRSVLTIISQKGTVRAEAGISQAVIDICASGENVYVMAAEKVLKFETTTAVKTDEVTVSEGCQQICANSAGVYVTTSASEMIKVNLK